MYFNWISTVSFITLNKRGVKNKHVSTALLAIQNSYSIGLLSPLFSSLVESAILKKKKDRLH